MRQIFLHTFITAIYIVEKEVERIIASVNYTPCVCK